MKRQLDRRLRYVSELSADVAHEFKSPLTSLRGASELLSEGAADDPEARARFLRNIELDVERLDRLVSRLLVLSRIEASQEPLAPVDLREVAEAVALRVRTPDHDVRVLVHAGLDPVVPGRRPDLETALGNLVENAVRVSPAGEPVLVHVAPGPRPRTVAVHVEDGGSGVPPSLRGRIFERFFTTDPERGGTGLGLSIVRSVAEAHGGNVSCSPRHESPAHERPGHEPPGHERELGGSRFTLVLPAPNKPGAKSDLTVRRP
jgi:two-component system sensor histidine kinase ChvG